ncbi:hypothetical protein ACFYO2_40795 [Streptomyces sp. NPDC006602]
MRRLLNAWGAEMLDAVAARVSGATRDRCVAEGLDSEAARTR